MAISRYIKWWSITLVALACGSAAAHSVQEAEPNRGLELFQNCVRCHTISKGGEHRFGPNLHDLMRRGIAAAEGFDYGPALQQKAEAEPDGWTKKTLNAFIAKPHLAVPGNDMPYAGLMNPHDRADLLDWLMDASRDPNLPSVTDEPFIGAGMGNPARGERLFRSCRVCHAYKAGDGHKMGPNLFGVMGRPIASAEGFFYEGTLAKTEGIWTPERLDRFLLSQKEFKQGTHRAFKALNGPIDRADLIAYLATLQAQEQ